MLYTVYESARALTRPASYMLGAYKNIMSHELNPLSSTILGRTMATLAEMPHRALKEYPKQPYGVTINQDGEVRVLKERVVERLPFCNLVGFPIEGAQERPKVLIAAAMSGHYATLLRDTVRGFARDFDPYITDWKNARDVPLSEGDFGLDDYVTYLTEFMAKLGPGTHLVATCQAAPPALIAAAALAERDPSLVPASLTLMAGPMDTRINKNLINKVTDVVPLSLMQANNIKTVPYGFAGAGRKVYPGFFQLSGFMSLSLMPHLKKYWSFLNDGIAGDDDASEAFRDFYDEYFAVLDMTESFYIETLQRIFFEHHVPLGKMTYEGAPVNFRALDAMPLLTIEGGKDNMCSIGQTEAAHGLCPNIPDAKRAHHLQEGVGHYGVFSGSKFQDDIYPVARDFIQTHHA